MTKAIEVVWTDDKQPLRFRGVTYWTGDGDALMVELGDGTQVVIPLHNVLMYYVSVEEDEDSVPD